MRFEVRSHQLILQVALSLSPVLAACNSKPTESERAAVSYDYQVPEQLDDGWETAHLADFDIDVEAISEVVLQILDGTYENIHSILLVKSGKLVLEEYFPGRTVFGQQVNFGRNTLHNLHSVTKSFTSALIGIAIDKGLIAGVDDRISAYLPQYANIFQDETKAELRIRDLLTMTAGLEWDEGTYSYNDARNDHAQMDRAPNPVEFVLSRPFAHQPGSRFVYNSGLSITLGEIVRGASGLAADTFAEAYLFGPLGITKYNWVKYPNGTVQTGGGLNLRPRDMAKFGQLFLNLGSWEGEQIISQEWVQESTSQQAPNFGYGFQWWLRTFSLVLANGERIESYRADGRGGQFIFVFPTLDLVAVFTGGNDNELNAQPFPMLTLQILPAIL